MSRSGWLVLDARSLEERSVGTRRGTFGSGPSRTTGRMFEEMASSDWSPVPGSPEPRWAIARVVRQTTGQKAFLLDTLVANEGDEFGKPVVLVLARPETLWFDAAVEHVLDRWAEESLAVRFAVKRGPHGAVAVLEPDGSETSVRLDLLAVA